MILQITWLTWNLAAYLAALIVFHASELVLAVVYMRDELGWDCKWAVVHAWPCNDWVGMLGIACSTIPTLRPPGTRKTQGLSPITSSFPVEP
jgi:hypothetical protein